MLVRLLEWGDVGEVVRSWVCVQDLDDGVEKSMDEIWIWVMERNEWMSFGFGFKVGFWWRGIG